jgi:hypothetical protein
VSRIEKKTSAISADFDAEEVEEKLAKLEKEIKTLKAAKAKVGT